MSIGTFYRTNARQPEEHYLCDGRGLDFLMAENETP